jgi:hypothetical protein
MVSRNEECEGRRTEMRNAECFTAEAQGAQRSTGPRDQCHGDPPQGRTNERATHRVALVGLRDVACINLRLLPILGALASVLTGRSWYITHSASYL